MKILLCCFLLLHFVVQGRTKYLDPRVFGRLSGINMPSVSVDKDVDFSFVTSRNKIKNLDVLNSTYHLKMIPTRPAIKMQVTLSIPVKEITIDGSFESYLKLALPALPFVPTRHQRHRAQSIRFKSNGLYSITMRNVFLQFIVSITVGAQAPSLSDCSAFIDTFNLNITKDTTTLKSYLQEMKLDIKATEVMANFISSEQYSPVFCDAMNNVLTDTNSIVRQAIINRLMEDVEFKKNG